MPAAEPIALRTADDLTMWVPGSLGSVTTYVLLEQERWFEREAAFVARMLQPGMIALDIGANHGAYSLPMADAVGPSGHVYAYEPAPGPRALLTRSRDANGLANLEIVASALSDRTGEGVLHIGDNDELSSLGAIDGEAARETVPITSIDAEHARLAWARLDFVKIDAEGEEARILAGGAETLYREGPVVMFELAHGGAINLALVDLFRQQGFEIYRLLGEGAVLAPWSESDRDLRDLNLFAVPTERVLWLEGRNMLVRGTQPHRGPADPSYLDGLAAYALWRDDRRALRERYAALRFALYALQSVNARAPSSARLASLARVAFEAGRPTVALDALTAFRADRITSDEPVLSPCPRFDALPMGAQFPVWLVAGVVEQIERMGGYSTIFQKSNLQDLVWHCQSPYASPELSRRLALQSVLSGQSEDVSLAGLINRHDHRNLEYLRPARLRALAGLT